jgi:hypothetical protein
MSGEPTGATAMSDDYPTVAERFAKLRDEAAVDDQSAAILVLAQVFEGIAYRLEGITSSDRTFDVRVSGDIETTSPAFDSALRGLAGTPKAAVREQVAKDRRSRATKKGRKKKA